MNRILIVGCIVSLYLFTGDVTVLGQDCGYCNAVTDYADIHYPPSLSCTQWEARVSSPLGLVHRGIHMIYLVGALARLQPETRCVQGRGAVNFLSAPVH